MAWWQHDSDGDRRQQQHRRWKAQRQCNGSGNGKHNGKATAIAMDGVTATTATAMEGTPATAMTQWQHDGDSGNGWHSGNMTAAMATAMKGAMARTTITTVAMVGAMATAIEGRTATQWQWQWMV
jgi:hypothetical protein